MDFRLPLAFIVWPAALVKLFIAVLLVCASTILQAAPVVIDADTDGVPDTLTVQLSLSEHEACALGNKQAVCWGSSWIQAAPALSNPRALSSNAIPCAIDDSGIRCWGNYEDFAVPVVLDQPQALAAVTNGELWEKYGAQFAAFDAAIAYVAKGVSELATMAMSGEQ